MEELAALLNVKHAQDWRRVTSSDIRAHGGGGLLKRFSGSLFAMLQDAYPELALSEEDCRKKRPHGFWDVEVNQLAFLRMLREDLDISHPQEWLRVRKADVLQRKGAGLLAKYSSLEDMLQALLPKLGVTVDWQGRLDLHGSRVAHPKFHWSERQHCRKFLEQFAASHGISAPADWRKVRNQDIIAEGGSRLLALHGGSLLGALRDVFPEQSWEERECRATLRSGYWEEKEHIIAFIKEAEEILEMTGTQDWYRISQAQLKELPGGDGFLRQVGVLYGLRMAYPDEHWDEEQLKVANKKASQRLLWLAVQKLFPDEEIVEDYKHAMLLASTGCILELDIFLPGKDLAFEYNGYQHYHELGCFGPLELVRKRDAEKAAMCAQLGIKLIEVPYWWKNDIESLAATIHQRYPADRKSVV